MKKMTLSEFLNELLKVAPRFRWAIMKDSRLRPIRAAVAEDDPRRMCPIELLHYARTQKYELDEKTAGRRLGLSADDIDLIVRAADDQPDDDWDRNYSIYLLRELLISKLGLIELER